MVDKNMCEGAMEEQIFHSFLDPLCAFINDLHAPHILRVCTCVKIEKINNLLQVDIDRREQGCAAHYEQYCQHAVTTLFNCNNLEQHG